MPKKNAGLQTLRLRTALQGNLANIVIKWNFWNAKRFRNKSTRSQEQGMTELSKKQLQRSDQYARKAEVIARAYAHGLQRDERFSHAQREEFRRGKEWHRVASRGRRKAKP